MAGIRLLPVVLSCSCRGPHCTRRLFSAADTAEPPRNAPGDIHGSVAHNSRHCKESCYRRLYRAVQRPDFPDSGRLLRLRDTDGRHRLHNADILRFFRILRHGNRYRPYHGLQTCQKLQFPIQKPQPHRLLATMAHFLVHLAARLYLHSARRQPQRYRTHIPEQFRHNAYRRSVARCGMEIRILGCHARRRTCRT